MTWEVPCQLLSFYSRGLNLFGCDNSFISFSFLVFQMITSAIRARTIAVFLSPRAQSWHIVSAQ